MSELKAALKEAKNAIKEKDLPAAMGHCKAALKIDRKNYQALAIFGKICQDLNKHEDSKKSLLLATQIDPDLPIAWQGLSTLHEKDPSIFNVQEAVAILSHVASITQEEEKHENIVRRLAAVHQDNGSPLEASLALKSLIPRISDEQKKREIWKSILQLLSSFKSTSIEVLDQLIEALKNCLNDSILGENENNYQLYLQTLFKAKRFPNLIKGAEKMASIFPTAYPLEWIARIFVEAETNSLEYEGEIFDADSSTTHHIERLLSMYQKSPWGNMAYGLILKSQGQHAQARGYFRIGTDCFGNNILPWMLLLESQKQLNDYSGVEASCRLLLSFLDDCKVVSLPKNTDASTFRHSLLLRQATALYKMGHDNHLKQAILILEKAEEKDLDYYLMLIKSRIKLGELEKASKDLEELVLIFGECHQGQLIQAFILQEKGQRDQAKDLYNAVLETEPTSAEALFELGRIHYEDKEHQRALILFLKAAKHDPKMSSAFLYLGHYYRLQDNLDKARKCYEKALSLNPCEEETGAALSDIYRNTGEYSANLALLVQVTTQTGRNRGAWAWLRLGLHHIAQENFEEAIRALQCAVQINPRDSIGFECLGDAYLARGSHTAAMKVFNKAVELNPTNELYPKCQIARINHLIGNHLESIADYENVLKDDPPEAIRIVALIGLAEVLLSRAKKYGQAQLLLNLREDCLYAIHCLCKAASENANNCTLWKLLGEACTMQASLPPSLSQFKVPARLFDANSNDQNELRVLNKQELLELGARCLGVGLQIETGNHALWHDLGINLFLQGWCKLNMTRGVEKRFEKEPENESKESEKEKEEDWDKELEKSFSVDCFNRATSCLKKSLTLNPSSHNYWNTLGVVAFFKGDHDFAQHAFLRSLNLQPSVKAWTHLGLLYFEQDMHLAYEAFSQAQALDPAYVACWVGQALVAESVGHYEAFDLFRHTTLLGIHSESCIGFGHQVLQRICDKDQGSSKKGSKGIQPLIPVAADCLHFYAREKEQDIIGQNMCGLILEMMGLQQSAEFAFAHAVKIAENLPSVPNNLIDNVYFNHCRLLTSLGRIEEASKQYTKIKEPDFYSQCGLALTLLKGGNLEEAYQHYSSAIYWLAPDEVQKSHALVALAFLQYKFKKIEDVKTLLFQSSCITGGSVEGLLALTSLGLIQGDATLTGAALAELKPHKNSKEYVHHITFLLAAQESLKGNHYEAKLILSRAAHQHPDNPAIWRSLSHHLLSSTPEQLKSSPLICSRAAAATASAARTLSQASGDNGKVSQDVVMKTMSYMKPCSSLSPTSDSQEGTKKNVSSKAQRKSASKDSRRNSPPKLKEEEERKLSSYREAQRAVLMCPGDPEAWAVLIATIKDKSLASKLAKVWKTKAGPSLSSWLKTVSSC